MRPQRRGRHSCVCVCVCCFAQVGVLEQLARDNGSLAEERQKVAALLERARQYPAMTVKRREELLLQVTSVLQLPPPPASSTIKARCALLVWPLVGMG